MSDPASTKGAKVKVKVLFDDTLGQLVFDAVRVKITFPTVKSS